MLLACVLQAQEQQQATLIERNVSYSCDLHIPFPSCSRRPYMKGCNR
jgi:hypothetical protein